jgi:hypothetical protein
MMCVLQKSEDFVTSEVLELVCGWSKALLGLKKYDLAKDICRTYITKLDAMEWTPQVG